MITDLSRPSGDFFTKGLDLSGQATTMRIDCGPEAWGDLSRELTMAKRRICLLLVAATVVLWVTSGVSAAEGRFWALKCEVDRPWLMVVHDPLGPTRYAWVLTYRVTNPTDHPVFYVPSFLITTETNKLYRNVVDFAAQREAEQRLGRKLANVVDLIGELKPGETKEGVAVFGLPDPEANRYDLYVSGLSNEYRMLKSDGEPIIVRKMLLLSYYRPGDAYDLYLDKIYTVANRWVWR